MSIPDETPETNGRATVALVDAKIDGIRDLIRAEFKDVGRRLDDLAGLEPRIRKLEQDAVRRVGPIVDELKTFQRDVETLAEKVEALDRKAVSAEHVRTALDFERDQRTNTDAATFSHREKWASLIFAATLIALNLWQAFS